MKFISQKRKIKHLLPETVVCSASKSFCHIHPFIRYLHRKCILYKGKCKAIPLQVWTGLEGSRWLRLPDLHMKVVRLSALGTSRLYPQKTFLVLISVTGWVNSKAIVRPAGLCQWKNPMTPSEIKTATFRHVAECLNQLFIYLFNIIHLFYLSIYLFCIVFIYLTFKNRASYI
jgi:hypothetical protein